MGNYSSSSLSLFICTKYWRIWSSAFESRRFDIFFICWQRCHFRRAISSYMFALMMISDTIPASSAQTWKAHLKSIAVPTSSSGRVSVSIWWIHFEKVYFLLQSFCRSLLRIAWPLRIFCVSNCVMSWKKWPKCVWIREPIGETVVQLSMSSSPSCGSITPSYPFNRDTNEVAFSH